MTPRHVWVDGRLWPADERHLSAFDRGFMVGDGVFETLRARGAHVTEFDEHVARLRASGDGLQIALPSDIEERLAGAIAEVLAAEGLDGAAIDAAVRITVSRGAFRGRGLLPPDESVEPSIVVAAWPIVPPPAGHLEHGLSLVASSVRRDPTSPLVALKTTSRADYVFARLEARGRGADDALFLTLDGHLSEATSANLFVVRPLREGGTASEGPLELATPALDHAILPGTTRSWLLGWAERVGLRPTETSLTPADLLAAEEAFVCSSVAGVLPVTRWEGEPIGDGRPGPWTRRARDDREAFIRHVDPSAAERR